MIDAATFDDVNPNRNGVKLALFPDGGSGLKLDLPSAVWQANSKFTKFSLDTSTISGTKLPPLKMSISLSRPKNGSGTVVKYAITGRGHSFGPALPKLSARLTFGAGACAEANFAGGSSGACARSVDALKCK